MAEFNAKKFVNALIEGAEASEIDPLEFGTVLIGALVNQLGAPGATEIASGLTAGQKAARTRARNKKKAQAGAATNSSDVSEDHS